MVAILLIITNQQYNTLSIHSRYSFQAAEFYRTTKRGWLYGKYVDYSQPNKVPKILHSIFKGLP